MHHRKLQFTIIEIATAAGLPVRTVRKHRREGRFDDRDIRSIARYIIAELLRRAEFPCDPRKLEVNHTGDSGNTSGPGRLSKLVPVQAEGSDVGVLEEPRKAVEQGASGTRKDD